MNFSNQNGKFHCVLWEGVKIWHMLTGGGPQKSNICWRGAGGVQNGLKNADVINERPLKKEISFCKCLIQYSPPCTLIKSTDKSLKKSTHFFLPVHLAVIIWFLLNLYPYITVRDMQHFNYYSKNFGCQHCTVN